MATTPSGVKLVQLTSWQVPTVATAGVLVYDADMSKGDLRWLHFEDRKDYQRLHDVLVAAKYTVPGVLEKFGGSVGLQSRQPISRLSCNTRMRAARSTH